MKIRRFIIYSIVYIVLIAALAYSLVKVDHPDSTGQYFKFLDVATFELPFAVWIIAPVAFFALLSIFHIAYYGFANYMFKRSIKRDAGLYRDFVKEILLGLDSNKDFKTDFFKIPSQVTRILSPWNFHQDIAVNDEEINAILSLVKSVNDGDAVDLKKFKLPKDNVLFLKNELNKIEKLQNYYLEILKNYKELNDELSRKANKKLIETGSFADIKKFSFDKSSNDIMIIINRFVNDEINLSNDDILSILDSFKLSRANYNQAAILLKSKIAPDALIEIFQKLKTSQQDAEESYIYILFELGMVDKAREILDSSDANEYQNFRILLFLKDSGKIAPTSLFLNDRL